METTVLDRVEEATAGTNAARVSQEKIERWISTEGKSRLAGHKGGDRFLDVYYIPSRDAYAYKPFGHASAEWELTSAGELEREHQVFTLVNEPDPRTLLTLAEQNSRVIEQRNKMQAWLDLVTTCMGKKTQRRVTRALRKSMGDRVIRQITK